MSLRLLLPEEGVTELLASWPDEPRVFERGTQSLDATVTAESIRGYLYTGCVPANEIAAVKAPNPSLSQNAYMTDGRTDRAKLARLYERGYTIRLGNLQRVVPALAQISEAIQTETGYSNYIHAFLTPPGEQGLRHHWDQQMAVIVQVSGTKRWQLWRPPVEAPMREYNESFRVWKDEYIPTWEAAGPDVEVDLKAGQSLLLPRGWVHNPHVVDTEEHSIHLTFAIRERTKLWLAEKLLAGAISQEEFRRIILPRQLGGEGLMEQLGEAREALVKYVQGLDLSEVAPTVIKDALTELEYKT
ncbi:cupin domain-containing protein [Streptomyces sp. LHD-70]|uniref:JmjC domain-containing protein n=1 Tax=Streptomyces sp. LHD-70 TaxID=3072140 RepID=UPI00280E1B47|nr:cupin domain-containing protein [Streptomyces sp. LHD-70]MDQ8703270.1 cupin domain-containing protein [Streptomyces sp. LHD-70]